MADHHNEHDDQHGKKKRKHKSHGHHGGGGHGGGEHEGAPEWLISFADNVTLMMGFFVIMLAMNMQPPGSDASTKEATDSGGSAAVHPGFLDAAIAIREAFNNPVRPDSTNPQDQALIRRLADRNAGPNMRDGPKGTDDDVSSIRPSDFYSMGGVVAFADDAATLSAAGKREAQEIARHLAGPRFIIEVRGHVSSMEAAAGPGAAMRLSYQRAYAVAEEMHAQGIPWIRMRVVGCADHDRLKQIAWDADSHRTNQRVEVMVTKEVAPDDPFLRDPMDGGSA